MTRFESASLSPNVTGKERIKHGAISRCKLLFWILGFSCCLLTGACQVEHTDRIDAHADRVSDDYWKQMCLTVKPIPEVGEQWNEVTWFHDGIDNSEGIFWKMCGEQDLDRQIDRFVGHFGTEGWRADMAWMMASSQLQPQFAVDIRSDQQREKSPFLFAGQDRLDEYLSEAEVKRFLQEPKTLHRYYRAIMWTPEFLGGSAATARFPVTLASLQAGFANSSGGRYWTYARLFVLIAHATGRDDLLRDADPLLLHKQYAIWAAWIDNKSVVQHLRPDEEGFRWHFDSTWSTDVDGLHPISQPDRPFPEMNHAVNRQLFSIMSTDSLTSLMTDTLEIIGTRHRGGGISLRLVDSVPLDVLRLTLVKSSPLLFTGFTGHPMTEIEVKNLALHQPNEKIGLVVPKDKSRETLVAVLKMLSEIGDNSAAPVHILLQAE